MPISREQIFSIWAPADSPWSVWAKPVLFATAPLDANFHDKQTLPSVETLGYVRDAAIVVDLPGVQSILFGLALAHAGYQPVPLYNGVAANYSLIDMDVIARGLTAGSKQLERIAQRADAPPAFLLNSDRMDHGASAKAPGRFDNRWAAVAQDMPSAKFLQSRGIRKVMLISDKLRDDLAHILFRYQEAKLDLARAGDGVESPRMLTVTKPSGFKSLWYRAGVFAGLKRHAAGGFGAMTPDVSSSGFYGGGG